MSWTKTTDRLPPEGEWVLGYYESDDSHHVVQLCHGMSQEERAKNGSKTYQFADEWNNNKVPYRWKGHGPFDFFGQTITRWYSLPVFNDWTAK